MKLASLNTIQNAHDDSVWTAAWVPATKDSAPLLLTSSLDETVRLWNPEGPEKVKTNAGHCLGVVSVAAHPSDRIAASSSIDSFIRVFDVATNNTIATLEAPSSKVWQVQFNPQTSEGGASSVAMVLLVATSNTQMKLSMEDDAAILLEGWAATETTPRQWPAFVWTFSGPSGFHKRTVLSSEPVRSNGAESSVTGTHAAVHTESSCAFCTVFNGASFMMSRGALMEVKP